MAASIHHLISTQLLHFLVNSSSCGAAGLCLAGGPCRVRIMIYNFQGNKQDLVLWILFSRKVYSIGELKTDHRHFDILSNVAKHLTLINYYIIDEVVIK